MTKIFDAKICHTGPMRTTIEVIQEIVLEAPVEIFDKRTQEEKEQDYKLDSDSEEENSESESESVSDSESESESDEEDNDDEVKKKMEEQKKCKHGMKIKAVDQSKTILVHLILFGKEFRRFRCTRQKNILGVHLGYFHKLLKTMDKEDELVLAVDDEDEDNLEIKIQSPGNKRGTNYDLKLMELDEPDIDPPKRVKSDAVITMPSAYFHRICREMTQIADYVEIQCLKDKIIFTCEGQIASRKSYYCNTEDNIDIEHKQTDSDEPLMVRGIYDLKTLKLFSKCQTLCPDIRIFMTNNYPLIINYSVATIGRLLVCITPIKPDAIRDEDSDSDSD